MKSSRTVQFTSCLIGIWSLTASPSETSAFPLPRTQRQCHSCEQQDLRNRKVTRRSTTQRFSSLGNDHAEDDDSSFASDMTTPVGGQHVQSRRRMFSTIAAGILTSGVVNRHLKHAFAANANAASIPTAFGTATHPIAIVGGSGRTGMAVAESIADPAFGNMHAITLSRSGKDPFQIVKLPDATKNNLQHFSEPFDVRDSQEAIVASLKTLSPSVVVYAASASRQGGNAFAVDDEGVEKVAMACKEIGALFVLISALAVDRPDSKSFQMTNTLGGNYQGIMDAKLNGETKTRKIFASGGAKSDYVIVRPGVLLNGKTTTGPVGLELNQGDMIGGGLSRDELAGVVVGAIQSKASGKIKGGVTVEAYRKKTAQTLEKKYAMPSGNELAVDAGSTAAASSKSLYQELFAKAKSDQMTG